MSGTWRVCSQCKAEIAHGATYWICGVSTCNRKRSALFFCTMDCWDAHLPFARHRDAWAEELTAPTAEEAAKQADVEETPASAAPLRREPGAASGPIRRTVSPATGEDDGESGTGRRRVVMARGRDPDLPVDVLIVASKLKAYIRAASDMKTSGSVMEALSEKVRDLCDAAIERAKESGRTTVMDRDF